MKKILVTLFILGHSSLWAKPVLHCLADEEIKYHKFGVKYEAMYKLNKVLIDTMTDLPDVDMARTTNAAVCSENTQYPSVKLLEHLVQYQEKAFYIPEVDDTVELYTKRGLVKEIINRVPDILHSFISDLQAACPTPDCLEKKVPGLTEYHERLKYLQMDVPPKTLLTENNMSLKIMIALRDIDNIILDCRKEVLEAKRKQLEKQKQLEKEQQAESSKQ